MTGRPPHVPGRRVGLLGGSFDPAHGGHLHLSREALKRVGLDEVWWLVSPGNPLKPDAPAALGRRMAASRALMRHPRVEVTDIEARLGTRHTARTIAALRTLYPRVRFVWLMGADNLAGFHRWDDWRGIAAMVPIGVLARPGDQVRAGLSPAARVLAPYRIEEEDSGALGRMAAPAWTMVTGPMVDLSSTRLRDAGLWRR